jgi:photosystem II stability/assembly factor-like uncharacterized protein
MVIDGESGRLYVTGVLDGAKQVVALSATDGRLLATYGIAGTFDIDPVHGWLYVDRANLGLVALDSQTGISHTTIPLPIDRYTPGYEWKRNAYPPQTDPTAGQVLAFRDNVVYVIDPSLGKVTDTIVFNIPYWVCSTPSGSPSPITWAELDSSRRLLYLCFQTASCSPHTNEVCISYDLNAGAEITRYYPTLSASNSKAVAIDGYLYGASWHAMRTMGVYFGSRWIWRDGRPWFMSEEWNSAADLYFDPNRERLYESADSDGFKVFDAKTMGLLISIPSPVEGQLVGYDPKTDQLYFLSKGQLLMWPTSAISPPLSEPLEIATPLTEPVRHLLVSPAWPHDKTLFGLWGNYPFGNPLYNDGGLYISNDGGKTWAQPRGGLRGGPEQFSDLIVSPTYGSDHTIFAVVPRLGIFKSTDGGQLWQPSGVGLPSTHASLLLSPGFEHDQTVFAGIGEADYRSTDGGDTWQPLDLQLRAIALSPEFDEDHTLIGAVSSCKWVNDKCINYNQIFISRDDGDTWERTGASPQGVTFSSLGITRLFKNQRAILARDTDYTLYRSIDGGNSWDIIPSPGRSRQLVYGPEIGDGRSIFRLIEDRKWKIEWAVFEYFPHRPANGVEWQTIELPSDVITPTALAVSPAFAEDGLLFVGTEDGHVVTLNTATLTEGE